MFKKIMVLLFVLSAASMFFSFATASEADDIALTSVRITATEVNRQRVDISHSKTPSNANGTFKYDWSNSHPNRAKLSANGGQATVTPGSSSGTVTITLTVTQTMPNGDERSIKSNAIDLDVTAGSSSSDSGCNTFGWPVYVMLLALILLFRRVKLFQF